MSVDRDDDRSVPDPDADTHAHIRFFKLLEVAYNSAQNGHYEEAAQVARTASDYYDGVDVEASVEARRQE